MTFFQEIIYLKDRACISSISMTKKIKGTLCILFFIDINTAAYYHRTCNTVGITGSVVGIKNCGITAGIRKYKSIIKKKNEKHDKIVLLGKVKLYPIEVLISKAF